VDDSTQRYSYAFDPDGDAWAARLLRQLPEHGRILELGPGPGAMTQVLAARGHQVTVLENDPQAVRALQALDIHIIECDLDDDSDWPAKLAAHMGAQHFDAILACDVLEHLHQPEAVLRRLADFLASQGRLVISIPNIAYAGVVAALRLGIFDYTDKGQLDSTHVRFFTRRSMETALLETGWVPRHWQANRVPIASSEFAWCWRDLEATLRQALQTNWTDFDVYQWMVMATPAVGGHVAQAAQDRAIAQELHQKLHALQTVYEVEHASLLEYQKAFEEAKAIIARQEQDNVALHARVQQEQTEKTATQAALQALLETKKMSLWSRIWCRLSKK